LGDFFLIMTQPFCNFCIYKLKKNQKMKKLLAFICVILLSVSCSPETDETKIHYELLPVASFEMPAVFTLNADNNIQISFLRPTSCHGFDGFFYEKNENTRTVAVQSYVLEQNNCVPTTQNVIQTLKFHPTTSGVYIFKFWKGKDTNGDDIFEETTIEVQ
jgi:hypothetical protein